MLRHRDVLQAGKRILRTATQWHWVTRTKRDEGTEAAREKNVEGIPLEVPRKCCRPVMSSPS
jgi:hypothetical protein